MKQIHPALRPTFAQWCIDILAVAFCCFFACVTAIGIAFAVFCLLFLNF